MKKKRKPNYIFCIEGNWAPRLSEKATVRPVLELLEINAGVEFIYRDCSTREELDFLLDKWQQKGYAEYKILYLAFHGEPGHIHIDSKTLVSLVDIAAALGRQTHRRLIYFGACSVMRLDKRRIRKFLADTGIMAACGYTTDVDWIPSTALDLMALNTLSKFSMTKRGIDAAEERIRKNARRLTGRLGFRMVQR